MAKKPRLELLEARENFVLLIPKELFPAKLHGDMYRFCVEALTEPSPEDYWERFRRFCLYFPGHEEAAYRQAFSKLKDTLIVSADLTGRTANSLRQEGLVTMLDAVLAHAENGLQNSVRNFGKKCADELERVSRELAAFPLQFSYPE